MPGPADDVDTCVFCQIVAGLAPARRVHEDASTVSFLDINPATRGHILVVPRAHVRTLADAPPELAGAVFAAASDVARLIRDRLAPAGLTVLQANERAGWQEVFHLHVHLVPRWGAEDLVRPWTPTPAPVAALDDVLRALLPTP